MSGPYTPLPPPPCTDNPRELYDWFVGIYDILSGALGVGWGIVHKGGSNLTEIETRNHDDCQNIGTLNQTSADATKNKHLSNADGKAWEDHRLDSTIHHTLEEIQDDVASLLTAGNAVTLTYDDGANTLTVAVDNEAIEDHLATNFLVAGNACTAAYDDGANTWTLNVDQATASANASASTVSVTSADADATYDSGEQALLNELKGDVNQLVTDLNAAISSLNDLKANLRSSGVLAT